MSKPTLLIIYGPSAGRKTTLATRLTKLLDKKGKCSMLCMDNYFHTIPEDYHLSVKGKNHHPVPEDYPYPEDKNATVIKYFLSNTDFDCIDAFSCTTLLNTLWKLGEEELPVTENIVDMATFLHSGSRRVYPSETVVLEGVFAGVFGKKYSRELRCYFDLKFIYVAPDSLLTLLHRRIERDKKPERGCYTEKTTRMLERKYLGPSLFGIKKSPIGKIRTTLFNDKEGSIIHSRSYADYDISNEQKFEFTPTHGPQKTNYNSELDINVDHPLDHHIHEIIKDLNSDLSVTARDASFHP
jgi:uridine kinase